MSLNRQKISPLYALTPNLPSVDLRDCVARLIKGGARWIQIREKWCSDAVVVRDVAAITRNVPEGVLIVVNDRVDLAIGCRASGVHLGDRDLPPEIAAGVAGNRALMIGVSTHSVEEAVRMAGLESVDYVAIGPIFASPTKMVREPLGITAIEQLRRVTDVPIVAIGGIDRTNIGQVLAAGADSAAVISALYESGRMEDNVGELIERAERR
ncbi:MAG: thiamine phosphate synthase [Acidobacteria bacterium]|nr:thiamine phosphate synthase [Acidobacteriota bacterium]